MRDGLITFFFILIAITGKGQSNWEMGMILGGTGYQGDLNHLDYPQVREMDLMYGVYLRNNLSPTWAMRWSFWQGTFKGSDRHAIDPFKIERNFSFSNRISESNLRLEWDPFGNSRFPNANRNRFRPRVTPYFFLGIGLANYRTNHNFFPIDDGTLSLRARQDLEDSKRSLWLDVPAGMGLKFDLSKRTTLAFEGGLHRSYNDFVDGISALGVPETDDWYWHGGANFSIRLGKKDSDGDGIADKEDACKFVAGDISAQGCPDRDQDGVEDDEDVCPDLAGLIDFSGCPDTDKDGIMDPVDGCPLLYGYEETGGCPDIDNDCITDTLDLCPNLAGLPELHGCPDLDGDGIPDPYDLCPEEVGLLEHSGCPLLDRDCDGIVDILDACPDLPDTIGFSGCPDLDLDGVLDSLDLCPQVPGPDSTNGCPQVAADDKLLLVEAQRNVRFQTGSSNLKNSSKLVLDKLVDLMTRYPDFNLNIEGYTDNVGRASGNQALSERRARACFDYLQKNGVDPLRMTYTGFGEANPIGNNNTYAGREMNRRVEFLMVLEN